MEAARHHADYVVRETRAEVAALRSEIAAARLAAARQKAETMDLLRQLTTLQQARADQQRALEGKEAKLATLRSEREQSLKAAAETRTMQVSVQTRIAEMEGVVASMTAELAEMKKSRQQKPPASPSRSGKPAAESNRSDTPAQAAVVTMAADADRGTGRPHAGPAWDSWSSDSTGGRPDSIRVQPGDSLWLIARQYRTTVADLKEANGLAGDVIRVGQQLILPPPQ